MINQSAKQVSSPNCSEREGASVECVVIHHISLPPGNFDTDCVERYFTNNLAITEHPYFKNLEGIEVSAHFFIDRKGNLTQFVDTDKAAWHAGVSNWRGREKVNLFSVGVELEGDMAHAYEDAQYTRLNELLEWLKVNHPTIATGGITGHEHIAPLRKSDPGPLFDWSRLTNWNNPNTNKA
jgi:AmpD protein